MTHQSVGPAIPACEPMIAMGTFLKSGKSIFNMGPGAVGLTHPARINTIYMLPILITRLLIKCYYRTFLSFTYRQAVLYRTYRTCDW